MSAAAGPLRTSTPGYICGKITYPSMKVALGELRHIKKRRRNHPERQEIAAYRCPRCGLFHLTSKVQHE